MAITNMGSGVREPAVAGQFYPYDISTLRAEVEQHLRAAETDAPAPKAIIAPHAGYIYSGPVAGYAYRAIEPAAGQIRRVVLLGPAHRAYLSGVGLSSAGSFATPLGLVPVDREACTRIAQLPGVALADAAHAAEHSLEVHLPFLQCVLEDFTLVPLVVGDAAPGLVADVLACLWGGPDTLVVISTDLSHYHDYRTAQRLDAASTQAIEMLRYEDIGSDNACGCMPLNGLLHLARARGFKVRTLDVRNSGDTAGPRDRVVGYGAYAVSENGRRPFTDAERAELLQIAHSSVEQGLQTGHPAHVSLENLSERLREQRASFVTLEHNGELRGCVGTLEPFRPLAVDVAENAFASAFRDPRFPALQAPELESLDMQVSVLGAPSRIAFASEADLAARLQPGIDGLTVQLGSRQATFLPSVWAMLPEPQRFLQALKQKAGITPYEDLSALIAWRYVTESFSRKESRDEPAASFSRLLS